MGCLSTCISPKLDWVSLVYLTLHRACNCQSNLAPGAIGDMSRALDGLRKERAPSHLIALAEKILLNLYLFQESVRLVSTDRELEMRRIKREMRALGAEWLYSDRDQYKATND